MRPAVRIRRAAAVIAVLIPTCAALAQPHAAADEAMMIGLTPEVVAALGVNGAEAIACLDRLAALDDDTETIRTTREQAEAQRMSVLATSQALSQEPDNEELATRLATEQAQLAALESSLQALLQQIRAAVLPTSITQATVVEMCEGETATLKLPAPYRLGVAGLDEAADARRALRLEARAVREGSILDQEIAQLLQQLRADADVSAALVALELNHAAVFAAYFEPQP